MTPGAVTSLPGIPNSEGLQRRRASATVPPEGLAAAFSPARGEGISAASGGASGVGAAVRLAGHGGITVPFSARLLAHNTFTFEAWLRLRSYWAAKATLSPPHAPVLLLLLLFLLLHSIIMHLFYIGHARGA